MGSQRPLVAHCVVGVVLGICGVCAWTAMPHIGPAEFATAPLFCYSTTMTPTPIAHAPLVDEQEEEEETTVEEEEEDDFVDLLAEVRQRQRYFHGEDEVDIGEFRATKHMTRYERAVFTDNEKATNDETSQFFAVPISQFAAEVTRLKAAARVHKTASQSPRVVPRVLNKATCDKLVSWIDAQLHQALFRRAVEIAANEDDHRTFAAATPADAAALFLRDLTDFQRELTPTELRRFLGAKTFAQLRGLLQAPVARITIRRVPNRTNEFIPLHVDRARRTVQVRLSSDFAGGNLVFVHDNGTVVKLRDEDTKRVGTAICHDRSIVHGVMPMRSGVRHSLFLQAGARVHKDHKG